MSPLDELPEEPLPEAELGATVIVTTEGSTFFATAVTAVALAELVSRPLELIEVDEVTSLPELPRTA
ncbi:MAG TPA: hypothetical protein VH372_02155 [Actinospica sp.]|nr:hypothetical protein [Actinospica sp.]